MSQVTIDWSTIRPLNGARAEGFEELCAQLARAESPAGSSFERKGTPDAGVECYAVLSDGAEWGWQAKYFDRLGDSQWSQLDSSVNAAIEKHPRLGRYFVCVPLDRADARDGRKSAKQRWDEHVKKWAQWASNRGMAVEFVFWGSHELLERLSRPQHVGRVRFWFDVRGFDGAWFSARLDEALKAAGPRYTPDIHVDLPIAREFEAFGRTDQFFKSLKSRARNIRGKLRTFEYSRSTSAEPILDTMTAALSSKIQIVLAGLAAVGVQPVGALPFTEIATQVATAGTAAEEMARLLSEREREHDNKADTSIGPEASTLAYRVNPFRERRLDLQALSSELRKTHEALIHAESIAGRALMLLRGGAGTGKTHLLCDVARQRVAADRPTVLLMGQQFLSNDAPWTQALHQLDLAGLSAEEFVGALESAAQAACSRALLVIDAVNEGSGRIIWPGHLAVFLAHLERSPWIGVVLSVRSSYEEIVIPEEVRTRAAAVTHSGFMEHEYDATRTFFAHYELELPSSPLLAPEFRNPLFLKTLCGGLNARGERRLPRGFHGITAVFELYLGAINKRLAKALDFDPKIPLIRQAVEAVSKALVDSGKRWLTLEEAREMANALLPGRDFERSLYRGLVVEGVLLEEIVWRHASDPEEVVFVAYERFADHLAAKTLLDRHLDTHDPASAFAAEGPLAFLSDESQYVAPGLLEAICIQLPERTSRELISVAPKCMDRRGLGDAFRQSIIWRASEAFSEGTREALDKLCRNEHDLHDTLDVLLTVATLPDCPLNATFLDKRLRRETMPERDAWWSVYLHQAWGTRGAADRLVDWASSVAPATALDGETVNLCATALMWMLTTSNRFLRDRATEALVCLLTGRLTAVIQIVGHFANVDDPYVVERLYAIAYGTAMRSPDPVEVGALATCVYAHVFASGAPPAHILLRDYARGVVERAIHLKAQIDVVGSRIRPPYASQWPTIPTEDDIRPLLPNWARGSYDSRELGWARNRIGSSVMDDDFARYVIGTNSSSSNWLYLRLEEPPWQSLDARMAALLERFSKEARSAWEELKAADELLKHASVKKRLVAHLGEIPEVGQTEEDDPDLERAEQEREGALAVLQSVLTEDEFRALEPLLTEMNDDSAGGPPRFDLRLIQRHVLWRVFDLGWTTKRFGHFDRFSVGYDGREASKAERIGKKYQWIAYHEIMALVADHFQYREPFREERGDQAYDGPWQDHLRDIDPSCTLRSVRGGTSWDGHTSAWWGSAQYEKWGDALRSREWVLRYDDLPKVEELMTVTNPTDGSHWLNVQGYFNWKQQPPADRDSTEVERRELWYDCTAYLIREDDASAFLKWAETVDFWGRWMPDAPEVYRMFLGEHGWAAAARHFQQEYFGDDGWTQPDHNCPVKIRTVALEYLREARGFDCSVDESYKLRLPATELVTGLGIRWTGVGADFVDAGNRLAAFDPTVHADGPSALLLRQDSLREFLGTKNLTICWAVLGEKQILGAWSSPSRHHAALRMSGAYILSDEAPVGFLKCIPDDRDDGGKPILPAIVTIRTPT
jgi:hypothetical protein